MTLPHEPSVSSSDLGTIVLYQAKDGQTTLDVQLRDETVWLTQAQMAFLFQTERSVITKHINNIFRSEELERKAVCAKFAHTAADKKTYQTNFYNLDVIIAVGYHVNAKRGTQFRIWATSVLKDYLVRGYAHNQRRLAEKGTEEVRGGADTPGRPGPAYRRQRSAPQGTDDSADSQSPEHSSGSKSDGGLRWINASAQRAVVIHQLPNPVFMAKTICS